MPQLQIRIHTLSPSADPATEGERLRRLVQQAVARAAAAPAAVVVRPGGTEIIELRPVAEAGLSLPLFLAGLTRSEREDAGAGAGPPLAVGLIGQLRLHRPSGPAGGSVPVALAFLEWPDCSWWQWQVLLGGDRALLEETEMIRRAEDGDPLPAGLGRWWSLGRRRRLQIRYSAASPAIQPLESPLVH